MNMTQGEIEERLKAVEQAQNEVVAAMRGDLKGNLGVLQNLVRLMNDVYQEPRGLHPRMENMEKWRAQTQDRATGMALIIKAVIAVGAFAIGILAAHFWK